MLELKGKTVAIVGLAGSGVAAAKLCARQGAGVIASDSAPMEKLADAIREIGDALIQVQAGENTVAFLNQADLVVVSPGVPLAIPALVELKKAGKPLISEIELASYFVDCPIIAITGSNGKTTTTAMTSAMLEASGMVVFTGGNIGTALSELPLSGKKYDVAVVELSSFQLEAVEDFSPKCAALLNLSENHLDRYDGFDDYAEAKMRIFANLSADAVAIINAGDELVMARCETLDVSKRYFGDANYLGAHLDQDHIVVDGPTEPTWFSLKKFIPLGNHNRENAMAALLLAKCLGAGDEGIQSALDTFTTPPHRLEMVGEINGVKIINDSKATTPASVKIALAAIDMPVVLLLGGRNKGADFISLSKTVDQRATAVIFFGEAGPALADRMGLRTNFEVVPTMRQAFVRGLEKCKPGDALLLSPGCASFDEFNNYEHRGDMLREWVSGNAI